MKIRVWPSDKVASGHYRLIWPAEALAAQGADVEVDYIGPTCIWDQPWKGAAPPPHINVLGIAPVDADVVVIQRPAQKHWCQIIDALHRQKIKVVVDVDDAFYAIPEHNVAHPQFDPKRNQHINYRWVDEACRRADLVTVTTEALKGHYGGVVLPNLVPKRYLSMGVHSEPRTIGWTGSVQTHGADLQTTSGGVRQALNNHPDWTFRVVGTGDGVKAALDLADDPTAVGWVPFEDYPREMAKISLGLVPLRLDPFNLGKSCLKMSEFAALGVPVIASPTPDNIALNKLGVGIIARPKRWWVPISKLIESADMRFELAARGRGAMAQRTYDNKSWMWADAWNVKELAAA